MTYNLSGTRAKIQFSIHCYYNQYTASIVTSAEIILTCLVSQKISFKETFTNIYGYGVVQSEACCAFVCFSFMDLLCLFTRQLDSTVCILFQRYLYCILKYIHAVASCAEDAGGPVEKNLCAVLK